MTSRPTARQCRLWTGLHLFQGLYYFVTGAWPLISISIRSFQAVTGKNTDHLPTGLEADHWLVMTVGVLILAIAMPLLIAAYRQTHSFELALVARGAACGLTAIDVIYTWRGVIHPLYLLDAALEVPLLVLLGIAISAARIR